MVNNICNIIYHKNMAYIMDFYSLKYYVNYSNGWTIEYYIFYNIITYPRNVFIYII